MTSINYSAPSTPASGVTITQVTVDFGNPSESGLASVTVNDSSVGASSKFLCTVQGGTADHDTDDSAVENITAYVTNIVAGVSYDVIASAPRETWGRYYVNVTFS